MDKTFFIGGADDREPRERRRRTAFERIKKVKPPYPPNPDSAEFWARSSFEELVRLQGIRPLEDPNALAGGFPQDEDIDEFLNDVYEHRGSA